MHRASTLSTPCHAIWHLLSQQQIYTHERFVSLCTFLLVVSWRPLFSCPHHMKQSISIDTCSGEPSWPVMLHAQTDKAVSWCLPACTCSQMAAWSVTVSCNMNSWECFDLSLNWCKWSSVIWWMSATAAILIKEFKVSQLLVPNCTLHQSCDYSLGL